MRSLEIGSDCIFDGITEVIFVLTCDNGVVIMLKRNLSFRDINRNIYR